MPTQSRHKTHVGDQFERHSSRLNIGLQSGSTPQAESPNPARQTVSSLASFAGQDPRALSRSSAQAPLESSSTQPNTSRMDSHPSAQLLRARVESGVEHTGGGILEGLNDPSVAVARRRAQAVDGQRINWSNPEQAIDNMSQIDSNRSLNEGGNDSVRCGTASLLAGSVLQGREEFTQGLHNIHRRADAVLGRYRSLEQFRMRDGSSISASTPQGRAYRDAMVEQLSNATNTVERFAGNTSAMTYGQMHELQEAVYTVAVLDQRLAGDNRSYLDRDQAINNGTLTTGTMRTYRDLAWSGRNPRMNGQELDMFWVSTENPNPTERGGHYILANRTAGSNGREVAFNPWPEENGTAFSRTHDGRGVVVLPEHAANRGKNLRGFNISDDGRELPRR